MGANKYADLEYLILGSGGASIVFLNGFRMPFDSWDRVYPAITASNEATLFNRRGVGQSLKATTAQDGVTVVNEMHGLLSSLNVSPPYILVAHSLGGLFAQLYARMYADQVAGVVFVESSHPDEVLIHKENKPPLVIDAFNTGLKFIEKAFHPFKYSEDECIDVTLDQIKKASRFPDIPIAVLTGEKKMPFMPDKAFQVHRHYQERLLALSNKSKHYLCPNSGHFPQITEPNIVISAIHDIVSQLGSS